MESTPGRWRKLAASAAADGGIVLIGVADDGKRRGKYYALLKKG